LRGNVVDLAVGAIIGAAFGQIVNFIVKDLIKLLISIAGSVDFSNKYIPLSDGMQLPDGTIRALEKAREIGPVFANDNSITVLINFIILAIIIFLLIKAMNNRLRKKAASPDVLPAPTKEEVWLTEMRDSLRQIAGKQSASLY
jgi:large conductance mechanosensitive channel